MTFSLADALNEYASESNAEETVLDLGADVTLSGADEITVVTDETSTDLEDAVGEIADDVEKLVNADAAAEKIVDAAESLEGYIADLRGMRARGVVLAGDARSLWMKGVKESLEAREIPASVFAAPLLGLQESFEANESADYSVEAEEKGESVLKRLVAMLKNAVEAAKNFFINFYKTLTGHIDSFKKAGAKLTAIGGKLKGEAKEGQLKGGSYSLLVIGGKVQPVQALQAVEAGYNSSVHKYESDLLAAAKAGTDVADVGFKAPTSVLPGGVTLESSEGGKLVVKKGTATGADFAPLTPAEIKALGAELTKYATVLGDANKAGQAAIKDLDGILKAAEKTAAGTDASAAEKIKVQRKALSSITSVTPTYLKYASGVAQQAYKVGKASAAKYGVKADDAAEAGAGGAAA